MSRSSFISSIFFFLFLFSCSEKKSVKQISNSKSQISHLQFQIPSGWPKPFYTYENNQLTWLRFDLGKKLFYDKQLSKTGKISCESCHHQSYAFSDAGNKFSKGINDLIGIRNTPALFNLAWNTSFMWDGGVNHIEFQPLVPLTSKIEMGETLEKIVSKIKNDSEYKLLFKNAYSTDSITSQYVLRAFAQFIGNIISDNSKYDKIMRKEKGFYFSNEEKEGYELFKQNCSGCHREPLFTDYSFRNNGIGGKKDSPDYGRFVITQLPNDSLKFKVPSLRNLRFTSPYMHDGRFETLEKVLEHYASKELHNKNADSLITIIPKLNHERQKKLILFLETLNDYDLISNKLYNRN